MGGEARDSVHLWTKDARVRFDREEQSVEVLDAPAGATDAVRRHAQHFFAIEGALSAHRIEQDSFAPPSFREHIGGADPRAATR
jgi:hypothetical protein